MLNTLRRIVQEINSANNFGEALSIMVQRVRQTIETQACTIFLVNPKTQMFTLMATDGLNPNIVNNVTLPLGEGLIGYVGERGEPINLENAPEHPKYIHRPEVGEEQFNAFLGTPIIHHRRLLGVLMVQQEESRKFDETEEAFMVTLSAQLAGIIAHAQATGALNLLFNLGQDGHIRHDTCLEGVPGSPGVGIGQAVVVYPPADLDAVPDRQIENIDEEIALFNKALDGAREEVKAMGERLARKLPEQEQALFDVYLRVLDSDSLGAEVINEIRQGLWAQGALRKVIKLHVRQFEALEDPYLRERASDIEDLGRRVLAYLQEEQPKRLDYPEHAILIGEEVTPGALAEVPEGRLAGIVSARGSANSHVAILARALGVPTIMGVSGLAMANCPYDGHELIVDGYYGQVYISPSEQLTQQFLVLAEEERELDTNLETLRGEPAATPDGHMIALFVNTGLAADASLSLSVGCEGVGLYRTEVPFMIRDSFPAEEEQRAIYRQLLNAFSPRPVIMRTLDVGGDKPLPYFPVHEENPFLGWRGIRLTLDHPEVFLVQIRAMLKASVDFDNLRIMLPMITSVNELDDALTLIDRAYDEVVDEGIDIMKPPIGVMIEVPSAVYQIRNIAQRVDFISVGSNDLTQYILAVDRNNARVSSLYDCLHPAVIQSLKQIVEGCRVYGKPVSLCGEMASDPASVILLMALGFNALSMNSVSLPRIKWVIRSMPMKTAKLILEQTLTMECPKRIRIRLEEALDDVGLGGLIRAGK